MLTFCLLLLPLWESVIVLCFVVRYFMSILVLQSSWWGRESWLLCLICLPGVSWWLSGSSSQCHGVVSSLWLWYFLIILTYYFCYKINNFVKMNQELHRRALLLKLLTPSLNKTCLDNFKWLVGWQCLKAWHHRAKRSHITTKFYTYNIDIMKPS